MDAREALKEAHRAVKAHLEPKEEETDQVNFLTTPEMRRVFTQLLVMVSEEDPDARITSWDEVRAAIPTCVALVPALAEVHEQVITMYTNIVDHAQKQEPTYVSPPPYV